MLKPANYDLIFAYPNVLSSIHTSTRTMCECVVRVRDAVECGEAERVSAGEFDLHKRRKPTVMSGDVSV